MERKIGEICEYKGEWYQCIGNPYNECTDCDFCFEIGRACVRKVVGQCSMSNRSDGLSVVFKKLEKVGEPYMLEDKKFQKYRIFKTPYIYNKIDCSWQSFADPYYVSLEIKPISEYMEENKLNLKPFDIQKAREGKPVCTRDGRKARIICFDLQADKPIVALITNDDIEEVHFYYDNGRSDQYQEYRYDLMMLPEKKEGWVNVMKGAAGKVYVGNDIYRTEDEAKEGTSRFTSKLIASVPIEWEE